MPESVKISELPPRNAASDDVIPAVDGTFNSTVRVTASSIAQLGGGPPAANSVTTDKIANNAVTLAKLQTIGAKKLLGNATDSTGAVGEVPATSYGLNILNGESYAAIRLLLDTSTVFTGQIKFGDGTEAAPSIASNSSPSSGVYFPERGAVGISTDAKLRFFVDSEGTQNSCIAGTTTMRAQYSCRAWVAFNGANTAGTLTINNQATIAARYGVAGTLWNQGANSETYAYMETVENGRNLSLKNSGGTWQIASAAADGRTNYSTPADNNHYYRSSGNWVSTGKPAPSPWIGSITLRYVPPAGVSAIGQLVYGSAGVSSVTSTAAGLFTVNFLETMPVGPDGTNQGYAVLLSSQRDTYSSGGDRIISRTSSSVTVAHGENAGTAQTNAVTDLMCVAVFR